MTEVETYNGGTHPVDIAGGRIVAPGATVTVDDENPHDAALIADGALTPLPKAPAPAAPARRARRSSSDTATTNDEESA